MSKYGYGYAGAAKIFLLIVLTAFLTQGCSSGPKYKKSSVSGKSILSSAKSQIGKKYRFGGRSPKTGFDCSGLAWWSHSVNGIEIPRDSDDQYYSRQGKKVSRKDLRPGDLIYFETYRKGPSHVAIYNGDGTFVHSPNSRKRVQIDKLSNSYYKKRYLGARRFW